MFCGPGLSVAGTEAVAGRRCGSGGTTKPQRGTSPLGEEMAENALIELVVAMLQTAYAPEVPVAFGQRSSLPRAIEQSRRSVEAQAAEAAEARPAGGES